MKAPGKTAEYESLADMRLSECVSYVDNVRTPKALRINIFGTQDKVCSFNCSYCEFGPTEIRLNQVKTLESVPEIEDVLAKVSEFLSNTRETVERMIVMGPGEPTLHPKFSEFTTKLMELRDSIRPNCKLGVFINGTYLDQRKIFNIVNKFDEKFCKLDAGNERALKKINQPLVRITTERILEAYRKLDNVTIMSSFVNGESSNTGEDDIADWLEVLGIIQPATVILSSISRVPQTAELVPVSEDDLQIIAAKLRMKIGLIAKTPND